ncbi:hypothetical protein [Shimia sp.]|uniref:hypothetical protein n=1 Tax=Shimia sp. TaxID=1954381 RepID=UPI003297E9AB
MQPFFMTFHVKGEIAGTLLLREPQKKLLIDLSPEVSTGARAPGYAYPERVCFTLTNEDLISRFDQDIAAGDVIEATGTFSQSAYIPHKTSHIDTTFLMLDFVRCSRRLPDPRHKGNVYPMPDMVWMH